MKKRILVTLMVMSLTFAGITACGGSEKKETTPATETTAETEAVKEYAQGTVTETGWESEWLNMKFTAGEGIHMLSQEELDQATDAGEEVANAEMAEGVQYEMMAMAEVGLPNVSVIVEKVPMEPEKYLELVTEQLKSMDSEMEITVKDGGVKDGELAGNAYKILEADNSYQGVNMTQRYYVRKQGAYMIEVVATGAADDVATMDAMLASFEALK